MSKLPYRRVCRYYGFSLIELMIAVAIVAIVASIAYPVYTAEVTKTRRGEAASALFDAADDLQVYSNRIGGSYTTDIQGILGDGDTSETRLSRTGLYVVTVSAGGTVTYTLTAAPQGWTDDKCGSFFLTNTGVQAISVDTDGDGDTGLDDPNDGDECWALK